MRTLRPATLLIFSALAANFAALLPAQETPPSIESLSAQANERYLARDYPAAIALYEQARQLTEQTAPEDDRRYTVVKRLATVESAASDYTAANRYMDEAIQFRLDHNGPDDPQATADRLQQVSIYRAMGDAAQARIALQVVMSKHLKIGGRLAPELPGDLSLFAQIDYDVHEKERAAGEWKSAIAVRSDIEGPLDVKQVPDLDRLGAVYLELRQYPEAEDTFRRALLIRESVLGPEHADLLATLDGLAYSYFGQKKYDAAETTYQRLIALWTKSVGEKHPMMAVIVEKVAIFYAAQQKWPEAKAAYERANAIRAFNLAAGLQKEAVDIASSGDVTEANELTRRALRALEPPNAIFDELREDLLRSTKVEETGKK